MSKNVQMVAKVGDEVLPLGSTHPANARKLVANELAAWVDGKLLILVRPAFLEVLGNNKTAWKGPKDDENVSDAEMQRRRAWFLAFVPKAVEALAETGRSNLEMIHEAANEVQNQAVNDFDAFLISTEMSDEEAAPWFHCSDEPLVDIPEDLWGVLSDGTLLADRWKFVMDSYHIPTEAVPYREVKPVIEDYEYVVLPMFPRYTADPITRRVIIERFVAKNRMSEQGT